MAIGPQNAFVLRQGLMRRHVFSVCALCAASDAILVTVGVFGADRLAAAAPFALQIMRWGGSAFLIWYGARSFMAAARGGQSLATGRAASAGLWQTLGTAAMLTWLNPHVYLDTVMLLGSVSAQFDDKFAFASGAVLASFAFFFALGYGARLLRPVFAKERPWQVLDACVGLIMWAIAAALILGG